MPRQLRKYLWANPPVFPREFFGCDPFLLTQLGIEPEFFAQELNDT